ncbi:MAG TPA: response regulator [Nitrososphaeraceae archaeon]|nr:response regulator [Nitrososphaeraceae archaeon]
MRTSTTKRLKIMIIEDEPDILNLYYDYLSRIGHKVINRYLNGDTIITDIQKEAPDIYLIDYRLPGNKNGIDVAIEILNKFPEASILFITAHEPLRSEISKYPELRAKNIMVLMKPIKLNRIEESMLYLVNKKWS